MIHENAKLAQSSDHVRATGCPAPGSTVAARDFDTARQMNVRTAHVLVPLRSGSRTTWGVLSRP